MLWHQHSVRSPSSNTVASRSMPSGPLKGPAQGQSRWHITSESQDRVWHVPLQSHQVPISILRSNPAKKKTYWLQLLGVQRRAVDTPIKLLITPSFTVLFMSFFTYSLSFQVTFICDPVLNFSPTAAPQQPCRPLRQNQGLRILFQLLEHKFFSVAFILLKHPY